MTDYSSGLSNKVLLPPLLAGGHEIIFICVLYFFFTCRNCLLAECAPGLGLVLDGDA